jgi:hypothetical protein
MGSRIGSCLVSRGNNVDGTAASSSSGWFQTTPGSTCSSRRVYATDATRRGIQETRAAFIEKPYLPKGLARMIRTVLESRP